MAVINTITGSKFAGCPVMVEVVSGSIDSKATFHRVRIVATVGNNQFEFSKPVGNDSQYDFDVSSALWAVLERHEYQADQLGNYPAVSLSVVAYDDYLLDGEEKHFGPSTSADGGQFYLGRLTDRERLTGERPLTYSRKPKTSPEICFAGNPHLIPSPMSSSPSVETINVPDGSPSGAFDGVNIYGIAQSADGFELRFINSLGVHENVFVTCLRQTDVNIKTDFYTKAVQETLTKFSRGVTRKQNDYETWRMSSGPIDRAWQQWWLHEPLMAKWAWLNVDARWLPVHIIPEETTKGIDRTKGDALTVEFTLRFDINGSPFA